MLHKDAKLRTADEGTGKALYRTRPIAGPQRRYEQLSVKDERHNSPAHCLKDMPMEHKRPRKIQA